MKNHFLPRTFLFLFFIAACTGDSKVSLTGKWMPVEVDTKFREYYGIKNDAIKKMLLESSIEFNKDGKFISVFSSDTSQGTYTYDEKTKHLTTILTEGKATDFSVESLEKNKMVLANENGKMILKRN